MKLFCIDSVYHFIIYFYNHSLCLMSPLISFYHMSILTFKIYNLGITTCILNFSQYTYYEYGVASPKIYKLGTLGLYFS